MQLNILKLRYEKYWMEKDIFCRYIYIIDRYLRRLYAHFMHDKNEKVLVVLFVLLLHYARSLNKKIHANSKAS